MSTPLKAPFPYFGGKSRVASVIWERLGDVAVFVDPFFGSGAVLLSRPHEPRIETVNDIDGHVCNVFRSIQYDPDAVADAADRPVNEIDLHAWHALLVRESAGLSERMMADPKYYEPELAGRWIWGASCWIGSGWCSGRGPWQVVDGKLSKGGGVGIERTRPHLSDGPRGIQAATGIERKRPHLMYAGRGVHRQLPDLGGDGGAAGRGVHGSGISRQARSLSADGQGIQRKVPHLGGITSHEVLDSRQGGAGVTIQVPHLGDCDGLPDRHRPDAAPVQEWIRALAQRLRRVRICCGDWSRILGPAGTVHIGTTGVLLDPPYSHVGRDSDIYTHDDASVAEATRAWAIEHGADKRFRIALCGYDDLTMPDGWRVHRWQSRGGYGNQGDGQGKANRAREVVWFSPGCLHPRATLFDGVAI